MSDEGARPSLLLVNSTDCPLEEGAARGVFGKLVRARLDHYLSLYESVYFLTPDRRDLTGELGEGVVHVPCGSSHASFALRGALAVHRLAPKLAAVRVYGPTGIVPVSLGLALARRRVPVVLSYEYDWLGQIRRHRSPLLRPIAWAVFRLMLRTSDLLVVSTESQRRRLEEEGADPGRLAVLPNWAELGGAARPREEARRLLAERRAVPPDGRLVAYVGRLHPIKRVDDVVRALAGLEGARLVACGDGPERARLEALARELGARASFLGAVPSEEVPDALAAADAFVLASLEEGMPFALVEAMAAGLPVVATRVEGIENVLPPEGGVLVPPRSPEALRGALERVLGDREAAGAMGAANREAAKRYGREAVFAREDELLRRAGALPSGART